MSARSACICALGVAPCGSPARFRCIDGDFISDDEIIESPSQPPVRIRCNETGLEWFAQAVVDFHDHADWSWKLAPESGEAFAAIARAGKCRVRPELIARTLDAAGRQDLAADLRREALTGSQPLVEEGDLLNGLIQNLLGSGGWREIADRVDLAKWPQQLRYWALAKFHVGEFDDTVQPLLADLERDANWEPMHRGTGEPFMETIDSFMPRYTLVAAFRSAHREECRSRMVALANRWNKSVRLGFAAAVLDEGSAFDWTTDLLRRGESFAGLNSTYKLPGMPQGVRIAASLARNLKLQDTFTPFLNEPLASNTARVLLALDPAADIRWLRAGGSL